MFAPRIARAQARAIARQPETQVPQHPSHRLRIGASNQAMLRAGSPLEREADNIADDVARRPAAHITANPTVRRRATPASAAGATGVAPPIAHDVLRGPGQPLDAGTRSFMEPRFGHDFGGVRVHADSKADASARALGAQAYTLGTDIVFAARKFSPQTTEGRRLLAHELAHVVQQSAGGEQVVQRSGADQDEEMAPTEGGAEESGLSDIACSVMPDSSVVWLVRRYFSARYPLAARHLAHYLEGSGEDFEEDVQGLFAANPRALARVAEQIGSQRSGSLHGTTVETAVVRQRDYDSENWRLSLGGIDQIDFEVGDAQADGRREVTLTLRDPYQWHPGEDRGDQCIHRAMERQKAKGAREYFSVGTGTVLMRL